MSSGASRREYKAALARKQPTMFTQKQRDRMADQSQRDADRRDRKADKKAAKGKDG